MTRPPWLLLSLAALAFLACEPPEPPEYPETKVWRKIKMDQERRSRENCLAQGGIIIESSWDSRIKDCVWPSTKKKP